MLWSETGSALLPVVGAGLAHRFSGAELVPSLELQCGRAVSPLGALLRPARAHRFLSRP